MKTNANKKLKEMHIEIPKKEQNNYDYFFYVVI